MKKILPILLLIVAVTFSTAIAQDTTGSVFGKVTTKDGLVIAGAEVKLAGDRIAGMTATTSERGTFRFGRVPVGDYSVTAGMDGYQRIQLDGVRVNLNDAVQVNFTLETSDMEQTITITGEAPLVDMKKTSMKTSMDKDILDNIPSARDPWVMLGQVPGVTLDRENVGGSESGQQASMQVSGANDSQVSWNVDGVNITDMSSMSSSIYYDYDSFEEMQFTTGSADASVQVSGAAMNFITKEGGDTFHGQSSFYNTRNAFQSKNVPDDLAAKGYSGNAIALIKDFGFDVGGPLVEGRVWFWGAYRNNEIGLLSITGTTDTTYLENTNLKLSGQPTDSLRFNLMYSTANKIKNGRGAAWNRPAETLVDQDGLTPIYKVEATYLATDNLILGAKFGYVESGWGYTNRGNQPRIYNYDTSMYSGNHSWYRVKRPTWNYQGTFDLYVDEAFGGSHEVKGGVEYNRGEVQTTWGYSQNMRLYIRNGTGYRARIYQDDNAQGYLDRYSAHATDTFSMDRMTFNLGVRFDSQSGRDKDSTVKGDMWGIFPDRDFTADPDSGADWMNISPRIGVTYDVFGDGKTVARASFNMYADQMSLGVNDNNNFGWGNYVYYRWNDANGDLMGSLDEFTEYYRWEPDPNDAPYTYGDFGAPITTEFTVGVDREIVQNVALSASYTYRKFSNFYWNLNTQYSHDNYTVGGTINQAGYSGTYYNQAYYWDWDDDRGGYYYNIESRPDYNRTYSGGVVSLNKRLSNKWMFNASLGLNFTSVNYPTRDSYTSPQDIDKRDGMPYAPESGGSGLSDVFAGSRWVSKFSGMYQLPYGLNVSGYLSIREGYLAPTFIESESAVYDPYYDDTKYPNLLGEWGENRLPTFTQFDARVEKEFKMGDWGRLGIILDVFNVLNAATELGHNYEASDATYGQTTLILNPRIARIGVRIRF